MTLIQNYPIVRFTYPIVPDRLGLVCGWVSAMLIDPFPAGSSGDGLVGVVGLLPIRAAHAALRAATAGVVGLAFRLEPGTLLATPEKVWSPTLSGPPVSGTQRGLHCGCQLGERHQPGLAAVGARAPLESPRHLHDAARGPNNATPG